MQRISTKGVSISVTILMFLVVFGGYVASGFVVRSIPALLRSDTSAITLDLIVPGIALWFAYWYLFHISAYLRPRTWWRELGFVVLSFGLVNVSCWLRFVVLALRYGI